MSDNVRSAVRAREAAKAPPPPEPEPKTRRKRETSSITERAAYVRWEPKPDTETFAADEGLHE